MDQNYDEPDLLDLLKAAKQSQNNKIEEKNTKSSVSESPQQLRRPSIPNIGQVQKRQTSTKVRQEQNTRQTSGVRNVSNTRIAQSNKKTKKRSLKLGKRKNVKYKGKSGLKKKLIALSLATLAALSMATTTLAVEDYNDKDERLIATVQDVKDDKFENSLPAKLNWKNRKKVTSVELTDGKYYEISPDSIVLLMEDEIKLGDKKNSAIIYTEDGIIEGKIEGKYLEEAKFQLSEEAIAKYTNTYKVNTEEGVNLRSTPKFMQDGTNKIMEICPGEYVLGSNIEKIDENNNSWVDAIYINEQGINQGFIRKELLKSMDIENEIRQENDSKGIVMKVDTGKDGGTGLNCRSSAEIKENNIIEKIPSGVLVYLTGENKITEARTWVEITYENEKGENVKGWVDNSYLKEVVSNREKASNYAPSISSTELQKIIDSVKLNDEGRVTGIDSFGITTKQIEKLNNNGIVENNVKSEAINQNVDISNINGNINFVYLRIGAMGYGKGELREIENDQYKEQVKKCEELGIPYGFYYYSTSINEEEAKLEYQDIIEEFESLGDLKYNLLPFAVDVELAANPQNDRQYGNDVTVAKAYLTNYIQENLGFDVMLYTSGSCTLSTTKEANVLDLKEYNALTGVKNVWMPMPKQSTGGISNAYQSYLSKFPSNMNLVMKQEVLDMESGGAQIDLNTISKKDYVKILENVLKIVKQNEEKVQGEKIEYER